MNPIMKIYNSIRLAFRQTSMRTQLTVMYFAAVFVPMLFVGMILVTTNVDRMNAHQQDLVNANNRSVRTMAYEVTNLAYTISTEISYDEELIEELSRVYLSEDEYEMSIDRVNQSLGKKVAASAILTNCSLYFDDPMTQSQGYVHAVDEEVTSQEWYQRARNQYAVFWTGQSVTDEYHNEYWHLTLVRQIPLHGTENKAVLLLTLDNNYLQSRVEMEGYYTLLSLENDEVIYSTNRGDCGLSDIISTQRDDNYYNYEGQITYHNESFKGCISTLNMMLSDSYIHVITLSTDSSSSVQQIVWMMIIIIVLALALPALIMNVFIRSMTSQVNALRREMDKASREIYNLDGFDGCFELTQTYNDLLTVIEHVQDRDANMFQSRIAKQNLENEQQKMEFKMLASQINPHFLYNTLEMIRMKALTAGDRETATAIKLLGKSMRYVLDNTGTEFTTLRKELDHIETYLQIQRLRFGDRVNYSLQVDTGVNLEEVQVLPLLLQPIVENAVLHGLEEVESGGRIDVRIRKEAFNILRIEIHDNGCGMNAATLAEMRKNLEEGHISERYGIGLYNIHQRLRINYGESYGVTIDSVEGEGTTVACRLKANPSL